MGLITDSNLHSDVLETDQKNNDRYQMDIFDNEAQNEDLTQNKNSKGGKKKRAGNLKKNSKIKSIENVKNKRGSQEIEDIKNEIKNQSIDELEESLYSKTMNTHQSRKSVGTNKTKNAGS